MFRGNGVMDGSEAFVGGGGVCVLRIETWSSVRVTNVFICKAIPPDPVIAIE